MDFIQDHIENKKITVMGLGLHGGGLAVAEWLLTHGAQVVVTDLKNHDELAPSVAALDATAQKLNAQNRLQYRLGEHVTEDFTTVDMVIQNPGVPRTSEFLQQARGAGVAVYNEASLFLLLCPKPIIGITGSKGKSTTTSLIGDIVKTTYPHIFVAGNIKTTPMFALIDRVRGDETIPYVILELSSWQLEDLPHIKKSPHIAVLTNILHEHLNRYDSFEQYAEAKSYIHTFQTADDVVIGNYDDAVIRAQLSEHAGAVIWFSATDMVPRGVRITADGLYWADGEQEETQVVSREDIPLLGEHNVHNIAAAVAVAKHLDIANEHIVTAIRQYRGMPGRLDYVKTVAGKRWYNDTTATAPDAVVAALESFDEQCILIAGGADKASPLDDMVAAIVKKCAYLYLLPGSGTDRLVPLLEAAGFTAFEEVDTLEEIVQKAAAQSDISLVLLSPGFASFASFTHEFERGDMFVRLVKKLDT